MRGGKTDPPALLIEKHPVKSTTASDLEIAPIRAEIERHGSFDNFDREELEELVRGQPFFDIVKTEKFQEDFLSNFTLLEDDESLPELLFDVDGPIEFSIRIAKGPRGAFMRVGIPATPEAPQRTRTSRLLRKGNELIPRQLPSTDEVMKKLVRKKWRFEVGKLVDVKVKGGRESCIFWPDSMQKDQSLFNGSLNFRYKRHSSGGSLQVVDIQKLALDHVCDATSSLERMLIAGI
jgi:hypothetical protein